MKETFKTLANALALVVVLPLFLLYTLGRWTLGAERVFPGWSQAVSLLPGFIGIYLRRAFYRLVLPRCGDGSVIGFGSVFAQPTAEVGRNVYVGMFCVMGGIKLEDDVLIGSHVSVMNGAAQHGTERLDIPVREQPGVWPRITVGRDSWVGDRAVIHADVGRHCVIGAGAVVTKSVPDYAVAVGVPARVIRYRNGAPVASD
jgi:serine acetyltransferase